MGDENDLTGLRHATTRFFPGQEGRRRFQRVGMEKERKRKRMRERKRKREKLLFTFDSILNARVVTGFSAEGMTDRHATHVTL